MASTVRRLAVGRSVRQSQIAGPSGMSAQLEDEEAHGMVHMGCFLSVSVPMKDGRPVLC